MDEGHRGDLKSIAHRVMLERGLEPDFPAPALAELDRLQHAAVARDPTVRDLRDRPWCSIDNDDSRDLDQLSLAEPRADQTVTIFVAIADVDAMVRKDSALDGHAQHNTTSVYTAGGIFPMLPLKLSTDLTSLNEGEDRGAIVIEMTVREDGGVGASDIYRALVRNRAKLAYDGVGAWLEGRGPMPAKVAAVSGMDQQLRVQDRVAQAMRLVRHEHGALTLDTIEARAVFDDGTLADLRLEERNRAKELIEDFMIGANGVTARYLEGKGLPSLRRVLRSPERWERIVELAAGFGEKLPGTPSCQALEGFLAARHKADPARFPDLSLSVIKLLGKGEYVVERPGQAAEGHFGLAVRDYSHSTAPNRRFPDLITHRLLKAAMANRDTPYGIDELDALARHCTEQEDNATKVERQVHKSAAALLLSSRIGQHFDAIVTGASPKGTWVRIFHPAVEGKVVRGADGLDVGDRVQVELVDTNVERGYIDFASRGRQ
jgi:VacB/RNase II family 3'-5' exoribonuclease